MPVILLTNHYSETPRSIVEKELPPGFTLLTLDKADKKELVAKAGQADYFLASGRVPIDKEVVAAASRLKMVQRTGVGTDTIDLKALDKQGIPAYVNYGVNAHSVAEHALLLILAVLRRLPQVDASVKRGEWRKQELGIGSQELHEKTVGLIGLGNIGKKVAGMLRAFGAKVLYFDLFKLSNTEETSLQVNYRPLPDLFKEADIISLHCALNEHTLGMIGDKEIAAMKPGAILVNTSRGPLVEEQALVKALQSGHLKGAGLDAFATEPPTKDSPLLTLSNVILTPHIGGVTFESFRRMMSEAMQNIRMFEAGNLETIESKRLRA